jgi:hypothetical protein
MTSPRKTLSRTKTAVSGGVGLAAALLLTIGALLIRQQQWLPTYFDQAVIAWGIFLFLLALAVAEIPLMIFGLRKVIDSKGAGAQNIGLIGNTIFVFFPVVYALPNLLLTSTDSIWMGLLIAGTGLVRFVSALLFVSAPPQKS